MLVYAIVILLFDIVLMLTRGVIMKKLRIFQIVLLIISIVSLFVLGFQLFGDINVTTVIISGVIILTCLILNAISLIYLVVKYGKDRH